MKNLESTTHIRFQSGESQLEIITRGYQLLHEKGDEFMLTMCGLMIPLFDVLAVNGIAVD